MFRVYVNFSEGTPRNDCWNGKVVMIDRQILGYPILRQIQPNIGQIGNGKWSINGDFCCIAGKSWSQWFDGKLAWWFDDHHLNMVKKKNINFLVAWRSWSHPKHEENITEWAMLCDTWDVHLPNLLRSLFLLCLLPSGDCLLLSLWSWPMCHCCHNFCLPSGNLT